MSQTKKKTTKKINNTKQVKVTQKPKKQTETKNEILPFDSDDNEVKFNKKPPILSSDDEGKNVFLDDSDAMIQYVNQKSKQNQQIYSTASDFSDVDIPMKSTKSKAANNSKQNNQKANQNSKKGKQATTRKPQVPNMNNKKAPQKKNEVTKVSKDVSDNESSDSDSNLPSPPLIEEQDHDFKQNKSKDESGSEEEQENDESDGFVEVQTKSNNDQQKGKPFLQIQNIKEPRPPPKFESDDDVVLEIVPMKKRPPAQFESDEDGNPIRKKKPLKIQENAVHNKPSFNVLDNLSDSDDEIIKKHQDEIKEKLKTEGDKMKKLEKNNENISSAMFASSESSDYELLPPQNTKNNADNEENEKSEEEEEDVKEASISPKDIKRQKKMSLLHKDELTLLQQTQLAKADPNKKINYFFPPTKAAQKYRESIKSRSKSQEKQISPNANGISRNKSPSKIPISPRKRLQLNKLQKTQIAKVLPKFEPRRTKKGTESDPEHNTPKTLKDFEERDDDPTLYVKQVDTNVNNAALSKTPSPHKKLAIFLPQFVKSPSPGKRAAKLKTSPVKQTKKEESSDDEENTKEEDIVNTKEENENEIVENNDTKSDNSEVDEAVYNTQISSLKKPTSLIHADEMAALQTQKELLEREIANLEVRNTEFSTMTNDDIFLVTKYQGIVLSSVNEYMSGVLRSVQAYNDRLVQSNGAMKTITSELEQIIRHQKRFNTVKFSTNRLLKLRTEILTETENVKNDIKLANDMIDTITTSKSAIEAEASDLTTEALLLQEEIEDTQQRIEDIKMRNADDIDAGLLNRKLREQISCEAETWRQKISHIQQLSQQNLAKQGDVSPIKTAKAIDRKVFDDAPEIIQHRRSIQQTFHMLKNSRDENAKQMMQKLNVDYNDSMQKLDDEQVVIYDDLVDRKERFDVSKDDLNTSSKQALLLQTKLVNAEFDLSSANTHVSILCNQIKDGFDYENQIKKRVDSAFSVLLQKVAADDCLRRVSVWAEKMFPECATKSTVTEKLRFIQTHIKQ